MNHMEELEDIHAELSTPHDTYQRLRDLARKVGAYSIPYTDIGDQLGILTDRIYEAIRTKSMEQQAAAAQEQVQITLEATEQQAKQSRQTTFFAYLGVIASWVAAGVAVAALYIS